MWVAETVPQGGLTIPVYENILSTPKLERASERTQLRSQTVTEVPSFQ